MERNTKQRAALIEYLRGTEGEHHTVEQIYAGLRRQYPAIGIATVYRNLKVLESQKCVERAVAADGVTAVYQYLADPGEHKHHHMVCRRCGNISDFEDDLLEAIEKIVKATKNFTVTDHKLTFYGICGNCASAAASDPPRPEDKP